MPDESNIKLTSKLNKKLLIGAAAVIVIALIAVLVIFVPKAANAKKLEEQLSFGDKYLSELNYKQAEAAYLAVIEIDPKNVDAYLGLADTYVAQGEYEKAIEVLEDALEELGGDAAETVREKLDEVQSAKVDATISESIETNAPGQEVVTNNVPAVALTATPTEAATPSEKLSFQNQLASAQIGDVVTFGRFVQVAIDVDLEKISMDVEMRSLLDSMAEEIEWYVLDRKEDKVLLFSKYVLDIKPYHTEYNEVTWEQSSIREWLNNTFYNIAFNEEEKNYICKTKLLNSDNAEYGSVGGRATIDNVFLLSIEEAKEYFNYTYDDSSRSGFEEYKKAGLDKRLLGVVTYYAIFKGSSNYSIENSEDCSTWWYLRSMGGSNLLPVIVEPWGYISTYGDSDFFVDIPNGIRPAIWVDIEGSNDEILDLTNGAEGTGRIFHSLKANPEELLSFEELNFLGHSIVDLNIDTVRSLLEENNYSVSCNLDWEEPDETDHIDLVGRPEGGYPYYDSINEDTGIADISASQYFTEDYVWSWGYYTQGTRNNEVKSPVGVRNINIHDTFGEVMEKIGFSNAYEVEADIEYFYSEYFDFEKLDTDEKYWEKYWNALRTMTVYPYIWGIDGIVIQIDMVGYSAEGDSYRFGLDLSDTLFQEKNSNKNYSLSLEFEQDENTNGKFILTYYIVYVQ